MTAIPRDEFPVLEQWVPLNHAGVAPLPRSVAAAATRYLDDAVVNGSAGVDARTDEVERVRTGAAALVGADPGDVAFVKNTTEGLAFVAGGLEWRPGDRVVVPACEFPSTVLPWLALADRGVEVVPVEAAGEAEALPVESFEAALGAGGVRLVAISWVQFGRGWRVDLAALARLCHDSGALLCADVIQGLGAIPLDLAASGVDFAAADAHKWLLGPEGIGLFYVAPHRRELLRPSEAGWNAMAHRGDWENRSLEWDPTARRFEGGTHNLAGIFGLGAAVELISRAGLPRIWAHVDHLAARLVAGLADLGLPVSSARTGEARSGIVAFAVPGASPEGVCAALRGRGILTAPRAGRVRVSPHGYNDASDIDRLLVAVDELRPRRSARRGRASPCPPAPSPGSGHDRSR